jgi:hypothetical protein
VAFAVGQSKRTGFSGSAPYTGSALGAFTTNPTVGNRIIVVTEQWEQSAGRPAAAVSDSVNGAYTKHLSASINDGGFLGEIAIHSVVVTSSASTNPTATFSSSTAHGGVIAAVEVSGLDSTNGAGAVDVQTSTSGGAGGTAASGASGGTGVANEFALFVYGDDGWGVSMSSGQQEATWTWIDGLSGGQTGSYMMAYKDSGAAGSAINGQLKSGVPGGSVTWAVAMAVFKLPGGGGPSPQTVTPNTISTAQSVFGPTVNEQMLPGTIATAVSVPGPTVTLQVGPGAIGTAVTVYSPTVTMGPLAGQVSPGTITSAEQVYGPTLNLQTLPGAITTAELVYSPTVIRLTPQTVSPNTISTAVAVYSPSVAFTLPGILPDTIASLAAVYAPQVRYQARAGAAVLIPNAVPTLGPPLAVATSPAAALLEVVDDDGAPPLLRVP